MCELAWMGERAQNFKFGRSLVERRRRRRRRERERERERERQDKTRQNKIILLSGLRPIVNIQAIRILIDPMTDLN